MPSYLTLFQYTGEAWNQMLNAPQSRAEAARAAVEEVGGTVESFYWVFGEPDGFMVFHVPTTEAAAAYSATVRASGRIASHTTHQIMDMDAASRSLQLATELRHSYVPPGGSHAWRQEYDTIGASKD